jgi:xylulokinase
VSLIGIDVGTSAIKAAAYSLDGDLLAGTSRSLTPQHPQPGWWEQDPEEVWQATLDNLHSLTSTDAVRRDPPVAMAISASGRENFPVDVDGNPLGPCLIGADVRGGEYEKVPAGTPVPEPWTLSCGHLRERMDPIFRLLWWREHHPEVMAQARYFLGWHDFLALRLTGRAVIDRSSASRYLVYDLATNNWVAERAADYDIDLDMLPEVLPWGEVIGEILPAVAHEVELPPGVKLTVGCHDSHAAAAGVGVNQAGSAVLVCGSFENMVVLTDAMPTANMLLRGLSSMPHPGKAGFGIISVSPTGNAVMNWARKLVGVTLEGLEEQLTVSGPGPSPVMAVPYLSGSMLYWEGGRQAKGALVGLTLATTDLDVVQALMESIAYEHINTLTILAEEGVTVNSVRAVGGGAKSAWWTQLKADMLGAPIEVVDQPEPGTLGAALLAGQAVGLFSDVTAQSERFTRVIRRHEPDKARAELHRERLAAYRRLVPTLIDTVYAG